MRTHGGRVELGPQCLQLVQVVQAPVARAFLDADLIDEAVIYQGPKPAGRDGLLPFVSEGLDPVTSSGHFMQLEARSFGSDRMTWWRRVRRCSLALSAA